MALGMYFSPPSMTTAQYDECIKRLDAAGRLYHVCFTFEGKLQVFDVWDSLESFETFGQTLMPIMASLGADPGQPAISEVHNIITG